MVHELIETLPDTTPLPLTSHPHPIVTRECAGTRKTSTKYTLDYVLTAVTTPKEPTSFNQAPKSPEWCDAMAVEFSALKQGTRSLVPCSTQNVIGNKWQ